MGTNRGNRTWFFQDVVTKDRFKERVYPDQSDRPSQATFEDLLETLALRDDLTATNTNLATNYDTSAEVDAKLVPYLQTATANTLFAAKSYEARVNQAEIDIDALQAFDLTIPTNYYNKTQSDALYAPKVSTDNRLTALETDKLDVSVFNTYKDTVVNPRLNVEHFTWKPTVSNDTYLISFLPNAKINVKALQFTNIPAWSIFAMNGNAIVNAVKVESGTYNSTVLDNFNTDINASGTIDGLLIVAHTLQTVVSGTYNVPSNVTLRLEYIY